VGLLVWANEFDPSSSVVLCVRASSYDGSIDDIFAVKILTCVGTLVGASAMFLCHVLLQYCRANHDFETLILIGELDGSLGLGYPK